MKIYTVNRKFSTPKKKPFRQCIKTKYKSGKVILKDHVLENSDEL